MPTKSKRDNQDKKVEFDFADGGKLPRNKWIWIIFALIFVLFIFFKR